MDNYQYQNYNKPPRKRSGLLSYIIVAIISGILGGFISLYIGPNYIYGRFLPMPEIYDNNRPTTINSINIIPQEDISPVTAVARKAIGSVVGITSTQVQKNLFWYRPVQGVGSGVVVDSNGYILTNAHVIGSGQADRINVLFENGDEYEGRVLWFDNALDLAVLKVDANNLYTAELGDSDNLEVGQLAVAIGNPLGLDFQRSVTTGVISGLHRTIETGQYLMEDLIQTDASINPGNSGGPLLNNMGQVIGINTAKIQTGEGLGFAIPINLVKPIVEEIIREGGFNNVYIGFNGMDIEVYERQTGTELPVDRGVVVIELIENSPAYNAGINITDIITAIDGTPIDNMISLRKLLYNYRIGDSATLSVIRNRSNLEVEIVFTNF